MFVLRVSILSRTTIFDWILELSAVGFSIFFSSYPRYDIAEILLKLALHTNQSINQSSYPFYNLKKSTLIEGTKICRNADLYLVSSSVV